MPERFRYIDWLRGLAVLIMVQAHTFDAWTAPSARGSPVFFNGLILGGFGAPLFLWLAGLGAVLSAESVLRKTGSRRTAVERVLKRGAEIFILAFLFRLQAYVVSPGGSFFKVFRVDILNVMGPSIAVVGCLWALGQPRKVSFYVLAASSLFVAMVTPLLRTAGFVEELPTYLQWYLRPSGEHTTFTLFPWCGFAIAGGAVGWLIAQTGTRKSVTLHAGLATVGVILMVVGFYTASLPTIYRESSFWTSSPTYFAIRVGIMTLALSALFAVERLAWVGTVLSPLARLGRGSLFVYWIHVELVYGYASRSLHKQLDVPSVLAAYAMFCLAIYGAVSVRDSAVRAWKAQNVCNSVNGSASGA
jgi:uncharacterized membrane protein